MSKLAALYIRVSTDEQSAANQLPALRRLAEARGFPPEHHRVYSDEGLSGALERRPGLDALLADCRRGHVGLVCVWALDRLTRRGFGHLHQLLELFRAHGVVLSSEQEAWLATDGPVVELLLAVFAWVAKQERLRVSERTRAGVARARRQGKRLGRPELPAQLLERGMALVAQGYSLRLAARRAGKARCGRADCKACRTRDGHTLSPRSLARGLLRQKRGAGVLPSGSGPSHA